MSKQISSPSGAELDLIVCPNCGKTIVDNPEKHKYRPKSCPTCHYPYKKGGVHIWKPNLSWIHEKLDNLRRREDDWKFRSRGRIERQMMLERQEKGDFNPISKSDLDAEVERQYMERKESAKYQQTLKRQGRQR